MRSKLQRFQDWLASVDLIRAAVVGILGTSIALGVGWANLNNGIAINADAIKQESASRSKDETTIGTRIDRAVDKILDRLNGIDTKIDEKAAADMAKREDNAQRLGHIEGLLEKNYGDIPKDERNR